MESLRNVRRKCCRTEVIESSDKTRLLKNSLSVISIVIIVCVSVPAGSFSKNKSVTTDTIFASAKSRDTHFLQH